MRLFFQITVLVLLTGFIASCGSDTKRSLKKGTKFKAAIEDFEDNRQKFSSSVTTSIEETNKKLSEEDADLPEVARDWEKEWKSVEKRYKKMMDDFNDVEKTSTGYFEELDEIVSGINNEQTRNAQLKENEALKQKWLVSYQKAQASIEKVNGVLKDGNDFHRVLVASSMRQKLKDKVDELNDIAERAKDLLADLEEFSKEGKKLVEG